MSLTTAYYNDFRILVLVLVNWGDCTRLSQLNSQLRWRSFFGVELQSNFKLGKFSFNLSNLQSQLLGEWRTFDKFYARCPRWTFFKMSNLFRIWIHQLFINWICIGTFSLPIKWSMLSIAILFLLVPRNIVWMVSCYEINYIFKY